MRVQADDLPVVAAPSQFGQRLTEIEVGIGLPDVDELTEELLGYANVLLGRADMGSNGYVLDLMEVASAYYARAKEIEMHILWEEQNRRVIRGSPYYKLRTGQLRSFIEMAKMMADLGSRRLTHEQLLADMRYDNGS